MLVLGWLVDQILGWCVSVLVVSGFVLGWLVCELGGGSRGFGALLFGTSRGWFCWGFVCQGGLVFGCVFVVVWCGSFCVSASPPI